MALFIYGMMQMGEALTRRQLARTCEGYCSFLPQIPLLGALVRALVTMIIQSSSATTVMVIGFVSAGLMTLRQSVGVIMGANIGTTITAWLVAIEIGDYAWLFAAVGFLLMFVGKKAKVRYIGQLIFSFASSSLA